LQKDVIFFSFFKNMFFGAVLLLDWEQFSGNFMEQFLIF
jgi:hypothetical protein